MPAATDSDAAFRSGFITRAESSAEIVAEAAALLPPPARILEVGSGTGELLVELALQAPSSVLTGIDLSARNAHGAEALALAGGVTDRCTFLAGDYLVTEFRHPFDLIVACSSLHLVEAADAVLWQKLASDLKPGGRIIATVPYDGLYNRVLWRFRALFSRWRRGALDRAILAIARLVHPKTSVELLRDRVAYMYMARPPRCDGPGLRAAAAQHGLVVASARNVRPASIAQPRHRLLVLRHSAVSA